MTLAQALILSLVEGVTEFLPISSTGHLIVAAKLLGITPTEFVKTFEISIQLGAIAAVVFLYRKRLSILKKTAKPVLWAFIPTAIIGALLYKFIKSILLESTTITIVSLFVGGIVLLLFEKLPRKKAHTENPETIKPKQAIAIGLVQAISVVPGVSRAAATILGGMATGLTREAAVEFSFLLAVPTIAAATTLDLVQTGMSFSPSEFGLLAVGFTGAFTTAAATIVFFLRFTKHQSLSVFGIYRIIAAFLFWIATQS